MRGIIRAGTTDWARERREVLTAIAVETWHSTNSRIFVDRFMAKRFVLNVVKVVAVIAAMVFWFMPLATGTQVLLFAGSVVVLLICLAASGSLDDSNTAYWPQNPAESQLYSSPAPVQQGHQPASPTKDGTNSEKPTSHTKHMNHARGFSLLIQHLAAPLIP